MPSMEAAIVLEPHKLVVEERPVPALQPGEALIKVMFCGICGSDVHALDGHHFRVTYPRILGHEFCGVVEDVAGGDRRISVGQGVAAETNIPCRQCAVCRDGDLHLCPNIQVIGFNRDGGLAQYVAVPVENLVPIPANLSFEQAALAQPLGVGYRALTQRAAVRPDDVIAVIGCGPVGLGAVATGRILRARVIAIDVVSEKLAAARRLGAATTVLARAEDPIQAVLSATKGKGADWVVEAVGGDQDVTLQQATQMVKRKGVVIVIGTFGASTRVRMSDVRAKEVELRGTRGQYGTYGACLEMVSSGQVDVSGMLSVKVPLREAAHALELMAGRIPGQSAIKILLQPNT